MEYGLSIPDGTQRKELVEDALTARINAKYREVETLAQSTVLAGIELGGMLAAKKESLPHGAWGGWLKEHFEGSERHAQRFMKLYSEREQLLADPTRVSDLSLRGAFREIATPKKEIPAPEKQEGEGTFEDVVELTKSLRAMRDRGGYQALGYESFDAYLDKEFPDKAEMLKSAMPGWELVIDNPPSELRGAPAGEVKALVDRLVELSTVPEAGTGLTTAGRQLQEIEERELYKLIGCPTFGRFCRDYLGLSRKHQSLLSLMVELADIHPFFDIGNAPPKDFPPMTDEDWTSLHDGWDELFARAIPLLEELEQLSPSGEEQ